MVIICIGTAASVKYLLLYRLIQPTDTTADLRKCMKLMGIAIAISHKGAMQRGAAQFTAAWEDVLY